MHAHIPWLAWAHYNAFSCRCHQAAIFSVHRTWHLLWVMKLVFRGLWKIGCGVPGGESLMGGGHLSYCVFLCENSLELKSLRGPKVWKSFESIIPKLFDTYWDLTAALSYMAPSYHHHLCFESYKKKKKVCSKHILCLVSLFPERHFLFSLWPCWSFY